MPLIQILILCYASLAEPVAYFAIFPFMPEMAHRTGLAQSDIGFWVGMIESLFSLVQMVLMIFYGRAADKIGRKPVLVFSLAGISVFTALFGMSTTLGQMIVCRCLTGLFAGSVVTIRTMISENCTKRSQARAFSWYMFTRNLGIFIGPLIGTYCDRVVLAWKRSLSDSILIKRHSQVEVSPTQQTSSREPSATQPFSSNTPMPWLPGSPD